MTTIGSISTFLRRLFLPGVRFDRQGQRLTLAVPAHPRPQTPDQPTACPHMPKRGPPRNTSVPTDDLDALVSVYQQVRAMHGPATATVDGMRTTGCGWVYERAKAMFGLSWPLFKRLAGYNDTPWRISLDRTSLGTLWWHYYARYGRRVHDPDWLSQHGGQCLVRCVTSELGVPWRHFVQQAYSQGTLDKSASRSAHGAHRTYNPPELPSVLEAHRRIVIEVGPAAATTAWLSHNGHAAICHTVYKMGYTWSDYIDVLVRDPQLRSLGIPTGRQRPRGRRRFW